MVTGAAQRIVPNTCSLFKVGFPFVRADLAAATTGCLSESRYVNFNACDPTRGPTSTGNLTLLSSALVGAAFAPSGRRSSRKGGGSGGGGGGGSDGGGGGGGGGGVGGVVGVVGVAEEVGVAFEMELAGQLQLPRRQETPSLQQLRQWVAQRGSPGGGGPTTGPCPYVRRTGPRAGDVCGKLRHGEARCIYHLKDAFRAEFDEQARIPDWLGMLKRGVDIFSLDWANISVGMYAMYAAGASAEGDYYSCVPRSGSVETASLGAGELAVRGPLSEGLRFESRCMHFGHPSAGGCQRSIGDPRLILGKVYRHVGLGGYGRTDPLLNKPFYPNGLVVGILTLASTGAVPTEASLMFPLDSGATRWLHLAPIGCSRTSPSSGTTVLVTPPFSISVACTRVALSLGSRSPCPRSCRLALPCTPCIEGRQHATPHSSFHPTTAPLQTLHMDRTFPAGHPEFASGPLENFCRKEGITHSFMLPDSPQQNGIAERRVGLTMEVACITMIHVGARHFLWLFAVRYAAHQLNLWLHVSQPET
ncbi:unnamed protein product [Closterium sp. NIES-54]